jgi:membrane protein YqaA with SNARE-associated domain
MLVAHSRDNPWYEYAAVATAGSIIGAFITFRLARKAGTAYLDSKFGQGRVPSVLKFFERWGAGALVASTAIPFPFPTSVFFAAAEASDYNMRIFLVVVGICRTARYSTVALIADYYGLSCVDDSMANKSEGHCRVEPYIHMKSVYRCLPKVGSPP